MMSRRLLKKPEIVEMKTSFTLLPVGPLLHELCEFAMLGE